MMATPQSKIVSLKAVIQSRVWVGNEKLISILWKEIIASGQLDKIITDEFWATSIEDGSSQQLNSATINYDTLQTLVESELWTQDSRILWFIFNNFANLPLSKSKCEQFGTPAFWDALFAVDINEDEQFGGGKIPIKNFYQIGEESRLRVRRFRTEATGYNIQFRNIDQITPETIPLIFTDILNTLLANRNPRDRIGVEIMHPSLDSRILVPFANRENMNADRILSLIERVQQSQKEFRLDEEMHFKLIIVDSPQGGKPSTTTNTTSRIVNWKEWFAKHTGPHGGCFLQIKNDDNLCLARAVVTAKARIDKDPRWESIRKGDAARHTLQGRLAEKLMANSGLADFKDECGIEEAKKIQEFLEPNYQIKIYSKDHFNALIYKGPKAEKIFHLYLHDNHFDIITKMPAFMGRSYFCEDCNQGYSNREDHRCNKEGCPGCNKPKACQIDNWIKCHSCNRWFASQECYNNHKNDKMETRKGKVQKVQSVCDRLKRCKTCNELVQMRHSKRHKCHHFFCKTCDENVPKEGHKCYIKVIKDPSSIEKKAKFIFFDFETTQDTRMDENELGPIYKHIPNCCIAYRLCDDCRNKPLGTCDKCGGENRHIFKGSTCLDEFGKWLFSEENRGATAIAHNAKGFDGQFLLDYLHEQRTVKPKIVTKGLEILMLEAGGVRVIDSLNFLPMPLSAFPKTFNETELKKGYFPHFFNTAENWNYEGPLPDAEHYGPDSMKEEAREEFYKWHSKEKEASKPFNLQNELIAYCESDVHILAKCSLKFRDIFMKETGVDPFQTSLTIASACNRVFRRNFLKPDTIGIVPHGGYNRKENQSIIAIKWIKWISENEKIRIQYKLNGGEAQIGPYKVDGLHNKTIYEFHGCFWHGCRDCMKKRSDPTLDQQQTAEEAYQRTIDRVKFFESKGYAVVQKWECKLRQELKANKQMKEFFDNIKIKEPIGPRDTFYGGRTNAIKLYHNCAENERIDYVDVCSLYPFICKMGVFPTGHPEIITENFANLDTKPYTGIIKCTVLPPRGLYHPVLPYRHDGKLLFPLCKTCVLEQTDLCEHTDEQRAINGSWVTLELYKAIEKGYKVISIDEVWHYSETEQYDHTTKTGGLFSEYINTFLRLKQQADGYPKQDMTDQEKDEYIRNYEEKEGIKLVKSDIEKNPGMRALAKLMLNSFWGKFGQRNNLSHTEYFTDPDKFFEIIHDDKYNVPHVRFYGESMACATFTVEDEFLESLKNTNPIIASFVTAQARLKLYGYLENLEERVLYMDTDSVIYLTRPTDTYKVLIGNFLGDLTNELKGYGEGAYIKEFAAGGPKNYGYRVHDKDEKIVAEVNKVRGIRLNYANKKTINFDSLRRMIFAFCLHNEHITKTIYEKRILRDHERNVFTKNCKKIYRIVYDKRCLFPQFCTLPFGY